MKVVWRAVYEGVPVCVVVELVHDDALVLVDEVGIVKVALAVVAGPLKN